MSYFYCTLIVVLSWPEDGRSRPKHVAKYNLIVIIAFCFMYVVYLRCIIYYTYCTLIVVLSWPEDGRLRPKHVAKYNLIVIIASCLLYVVY